MVGLVQFLPMLLVTLVAGHVADRFNRKTIIAVCQAVESATLALLALNSHFHRLHPAGIYCGVALIGASRAFENPSTQALVPGLVNAAKGSQAIAWFASATQTASIVGPALGGFLYAFGARDILNTGPWGLGLLRLAPAVGAILASIYLAHYPIHRQAGLRMFAAVIIFGLATVVFAFSHNLVLSLSVLCILGAADVTSVVVLASLVQLETPDGMLDRVSAVNSLFIGTSNQLGQFESGVTAAWFGLVPATVIGGIGSILIALIWMALFPGLRQLQNVAGSALGDKVRSVK